MMKLDSGKAFEVQCLSVVNLPFAKAIAAGKRASGRPLMFCGNSESRRGRQRRLLDALIAVPRVGISSLTVETTDAR